MSVSAFIFRDKEGIAKTVKQDHTGVSAGEMKKIVAREYGVEARNIQVVRVL